MKKIIENETTFGLIEEMLKIGLNNDEARLQNEYRIAKQLAQDLLSAVSPHDINVTDVGWFEDEAKRGLQFYAVMLGQEKGTRKNSAGRKLYVKFDGKQVRVEGIEELTLFVLFQKCRRLECYTLYEKKLLREMFKPEGTIWQPQDVYEFTAHQAPKLGLFYGRCKGGWKGFTSAWMQKSEN